MLHAILNNNTVEYVYNIESDEEIRDLMSKNQLVVNVDDYEVPPAAGWILQGVMVVPPIVVAVVPEKVTPRQIRIALTLAGISESFIDSAIDALSEPNRSVAKITWEYSTEVFRNNPLILSLAPAMGLTSEQVDGLFIQAAKL